jgi:hypothetical protein
MNAFGNVAFLKLNAFKILQFLIAEYVMSLKGFKNGRMKESS